MANAAQTASKARYIPHRRRQVSKNDPLSSTRSYKRIMIGSETATSFEPSASSVAAAVTVPQQ